MRIKLLIARGLAREVALVTRPWPHLPAKTMVGEYYASRALAHACAGDRAVALELARESEELTHAIEAKVVVLCTNAIVSLSQDGDDGHVLARDAFVFAQGSGNLDGFIAAYRGFPKLVGALLGESQGDADLRDVLSRARDVATARKYGLRLNRAETHPALSPRETEVYSLVLEGLSNREIARALFISEVTVKVHVRHILAKFGARSRAELLARANRSQDDYAATAATSASD